MSRQDELDELNRVNRDRAVKAYAKTTDRPGLVIFGAGCAIVLVIAALVLGGWAVGWWFKDKNVNRTAHLYRSSYGNQQTLRDQITANIGTVLTITTQVDAATGTEVGALKAQRYAVAGIVCGEAAQVTGDPLNPQQAGFISANCEDGVVRPGSQFAPSP